MIRRLLNLLTLLSLLLCVAAGALWVRSYSTVAGVEFGYRGVRWQIRSQAGRVWLDNGPQRKLEEARQKEEYARLLAEVGAELRRAASPPVLYGPPDPRPPDPRAERDARVDMMRRLTAKGNEVNNRLRGLYQRHLNERTPSVRRSVAYPGLVVAGAILPVSWLVSRGFARLRRGSRTRRGLCPSCGYDVRATPDRCPECGKDAVGAPRQRSN